MDAGHGNFFAPSRLRQYVDQERRVELTAIAFPARIVILARIELRRRLAALVEIRRVALLDFRPGPAFGRGGVVVGRFRERRCVARPRDHERQQDRRSAEAAKGSEQGSKARHHGVTRAIRKTHPDATFTCNFRTSRKSSL